MQAEQADDPEESERLLDTAAEYESRSLLGAANHREGLVAMVFDEETGNAVDHFDYTAEELRRRVADLDAEDAT